MLFEWQMRPDYTNNIFYLFLSPILSHDMRQEDLGGGLEKHKR